MAVEGLIECLSANSGQDIGLQRGGGDYSSQKSRVKKCQKIALRKFESKSTSK